MIFEAIVTLMNEIEELSLRQYTLTFMRGGVEGLRLYDEIVGKVRQLREGIENAINVSPAEMQYISQRTVALEQMSNLIIQKSKTEKEWIQELVNAQQAD